MKINLILVATIAIMASNTSQARVLLKDIGIVGLLSHDMFAWDHKREVNTENGRLDLSTIFDYENGKRWKKGGNPKNGENAPVWSITKRLVKFHKKQLKSNGNDFTKARLKTVKRFHQMIRGSYERLSGYKFPETAHNLKVNNIEQAALRAMHDILPGRVNIYRGELYPIKSFKLTNFVFAKFYLNSKELEQEISYFDGDYDEEYKNIKIPFTNVRLNLKEIDRKFIEKFSPYLQKNMLSELKEVGEGSLEISEVSFMYHIEELLQKGICSTSNKWIPKSIPCH